MAPVELRMWLQRFPISIICSIAVAVGCLWGFPAFFGKHWATITAPLVALGKSLGFEKYFADPAEAAIFIFGSWAAHMCWLIGHNLVLGAIYAIHHPFFEQWKIIPKPWPWRDPSPEKRAEFWGIFWGSVRQVLFNNICVGLPMSFVAYATRVPGMFSGDLASFPTPLQLALQVLICMIVEDFTFYWSHRTLHTPFFYKRIHKLHHKYLHSIALASENAHPVEFLLGNLIPVVVGPTLLGLITGQFHTFSFWFWVWTRIGESADTHSGYAFPITPFKLLPLASSTEAHDFHHSHNVGCFASQFVWCDRLFGTDKAFLAHQAKVLDKAEAKKD